MDSAGGLVSSPLLSKSALRQMGRGAALPVEPQSDFVDIGAMRGP